MQQIAEPLIDGFGRVVDDLRISLTDRCNFRCVYCMPEEGLDWLARDEILTEDEIVRLATVFTGLGVRTLRLTGGEPLLRKNIAGIVERLRGIGDDIDLALTTNGFLLRRYATALRAAGLDRVNVSLDSLDAERFAAMTRRSSLAEVLDGINAAREAGLDPIKVNVVVMRGVNDAEAATFARLARDTGVHVRFIEYMPLDADNQWERDKVVAGEELLDAIESEMTLTPRQNGHDPATRFQTGVGEVGFINSVTEPFCARCNRVRITADGQLRTCLFALDETDLRTPLRDGATDSDIAKLIRAALLGKQWGHTINDVDFVRPARSMSQIGG